MLKPCIINILLANQREVNRKKRENWRNWTICVSVVSVQVQIYYNIYYYTTGLQFMSLVQQSQRKTSSLLQQCRLSKLFFFLIRLSGRPRLLSLMQLIWACYANVPSFYQTKCWVLHLFTATAKYISESPKTKKTVIHIFRFVSAKTTKQKKGQTERLLTSNTRI